jgi:hypothetical protein
MIELQGAKSRDVICGEFVMQPVKQEADLCEVILYSEGNSWLFSTFANASSPREALEEAEREVSLHSLHHRLGNGKFKASSAHVLHGFDDHSFAKRDGRWELRHRRGRLAWGKAFAQA